MRTGVRDQAGRAGWWPAAVAVAAGTAAASGQAIVPSTEEAVPRGLVYTMQGYPQQMGLDGFGCGFADLDADGDADVVIVGGVDVGGGSRVGIFENDGNGFFTDHSLTSGIPLLPQASAFAASDVDGDGLPDLYLTQSGEPNVLVRNLGGFTFTDITGSAGVGDPGAGTAPSFGDFDGDGWLDLYVCNYNGGIPGTEDIDNKLYRNLGGGVFEDVSVAQTVNDHGYGFQAVWFDYDLDGDVDLYLSNDRGHQPPLFRTNQLWRNDDGQLVNVSVGSGADVGLFSMGVACGDFDGNGQPDLYCTNIAGYEEGYNPLLLNFDATFFELSAFAGVDHWITSWGSIFYDFNNDGAQDLYVNNQFEPNSLYLGDFPCVEVAAAAGVTANGNVSYGSAVADVEGDGDLDLLVNNLTGNVELFINHDGELRQWIRYRLVGLGANPEAVGASVDTRTGTTWRYREVLAGGNGYLGQNELILHVGLGDATVAEEVVVRWPGGAPTRTLTNLPASTTWTLYPPSRLGDADGDGAATLDDYFVFAGCYAGGFAPGCEMMDFDGDSVIALADFDAFLAVYADPVLDCDGDGEADLLEILLDPALDGDQTGIPDACEAVGDLDGDGQVGVTDFLMLLAAWGPCSCPADLDGDGQVGVTDFLALLANWGPL